MDPDDIIRNIDESVLADCAAEIEKLKRKRHGLKAAFTQILNVIDKSIQASLGPNNKINRSESNRLTIERAFDKLEQRYEKLEKVTVLSESNLTKPRLCSKMAVFKME